MKRATLLAEQGDESNQYVPGVSHDELVRIAGEVGVTPEILQKAIDSSRNSTEKSRAKWDPTQEFEQVVEGEIEPADLDQLLEGLKLMNGKQGLVQVGRTLQANVWVGGSSANLEIVSRKGRTRIRAKNSPLVPYFAGMHWSAILSLVSVLVFSVKGFWWIGVPLALLLLTVGFFIFSMMLNKGIEGTRKLVKNVAELAEESIADKYKTLKNASPVSTTSADVTQQIEN